jgi:hypothetical protein
MVEAICVISVFALFFLGMVYFESMYHTKIRVQQLARAGAVAYAMDACKDGDPLKTVSQDLQGAQNNGSSNQQGSATANVPPPNPPVGNQGGDPVGNAMGDQGFALDPIGGISVQGTAGATTGSTPGSQSRSFKSTVKSDSYVSCGDEQKAGTADAVFHFVGGLFK